MISTVGKDTKGRYWFKSDTLLIDITNALHFYVARGGWWWKRWNLYGMFQVPRKYWSYYHDRLEEHPTDKIKEAKLLGTYPSAAQASMALEEVMKIKGITAI